MLPTLEETENLYDDPNFISETTEENTPGYYEKRPSLFDPLDIQTLKRSMSKKKKKKNFLTIYITKVHLFVLHLNFN